MDKLKKTIKTARNTAAIWVACIAASVALAAAAVALPVVSAIVLLARLIAPGRPSKPRSVPLGPLLAKLLTSPAGSRREERPSSGS